MATMKELRDERLRKLEDLKGLGVNPYPAEANRTHDIRDVTEKFEELEGKDVTVVGRIMTTRKFGKLAFLVIRDMSGQVQLFLKSDTVAPLDAAISQLGMSELNLLDPVISSKQAVPSSEQRRVRFRSTCARYASSRSPCAVCRLTKKDSRTKKSAFVVAISI